MIRSHHDTLTPYVTRFLTEQATGELVLVNQEPALSWRAGISATGSGPAGPRRDAGPETQAIGAVGSRRRRSLSTGANSSIIQGASSRAALIRRTTWGRGVVLPRSIR